MRQKGLEMNEINFQGDMYKLEVGEKVKVYKNDVEIFSLRRFDVYGPGLHIVKGRLMLLYRGYDCVDRGTVLAG